MSKIAFIFPGQGTQFVGMGKDLLDNHPLGIATAIMANEVLGFNLQEIMESGPKELLDKTENTQPAILTLSYMLAKILDEEGISPHGVAGLSLGEYSALVYSGVISFQSALPLVKKRGEIMQKAVPMGVGGMVALLGADIKKVEILLENVESGYADVANYNCPGQYVITGELKAIDEILSKAKDFGIRRAIKLDVSGPFHSKLLEGAGKELGEELKAIQFKEPEIPVYNNVTSEIYKNSEQIKNLLEKQVSNSVLWEQTIERMIRDGYTGFVEVGPQKTLSPMVKKISKEPWVKNVEDYESLQEFILFYKELGIKGGI